VRLAAIDIGTNSIHMVIADVASDGGITVVDRTKEMVRLGRGVFVTGRIARDAMELGVRTLRTFTRLARVRRVQRIRAVATSAVREAQNGTTFVERARREAGLQVKVISGREEARLIYRAAAHSLGLGGEPYLLLDVGGGSVELVLVRDGRPVWLESLPLGVARLAEQFLPTDPPTPKQRKQLVAHIEDELGRVLRDVRRTGTTHAVGTSGTVHALVAMVHTANGDDPGRLHGISVTTAELSQLRRALVGCTAAERLALPGADPKRVDLLPASAILVETCLRRGKITDLTACTWALREGILLDLAGIAVTAGASRDDVRRRSVEALGRRFGGENAHGQQTARLARQLFDATAPALGLEEECGDLLEYAALLHDIGRSIEHEHHHRHSAYLIHNGELLGFEPTEIDIMAGIARGHRKQPPKPSDPELQALPAPARRTVRALAVLLRLADALDRTHFGVVRDLTCTLTPARLLIELDAGSESVDLELWAATRRTAALSRLLDRPVVLRARSTRGRAAIASARALA
jgi:exopolyphosphatase/guanosine-5'-triphosphate,3'-diphosphate pyrophosphatase